MGLLGEQEDPSHSGAGYGSRGVRAAHRGLHSHKEEFGRFGIQRRATGCSPGPSSRVHGASTHQGKLGHLLENAREGVIFQPHHGSGKTFTQSGNEHLQWSEPCTRPFWASPHFSLSLRQPVTGRWIWVLTLALIILV